MLALLPLLLLLVAVATVGQLAACGRKTLLQPHFVVVVCDSLRADHLDLYGYGKLTAPALTEWARTGLVFERATAPSNWTRPSVHALFTGRHPGPDRRFEADEPVPADEHVLAERLSAAGYETLAVSANPFVSTTHGADRGFDLFVDLGWPGAPEEGSFKDSIASPYVLDRVEYMLSSRRRSGRPVLLYVHLMDAHPPYDPPERLRRFDEPAGDGTESAPQARSQAQGQAKAHAQAQAQAERNRQLALYDAEIARLDEGLARLRALVAEHLADRPVVTVVTADHGEAFGTEDVAASRDASLATPRVRVPLVLHGVRPNGRVPTRVGLIDVAPTLAQLGGTDLGEPVDGRALITRDGRVDAPAGRPFIVYRALPGDEPASGALAVLSDARRAAREERGWRLFDADAGEDLTLLEPLELARLRDAATDWLADGLRRTAASAAAVPVELPAGADDTLDALGFVEPTR